MYLAPNSQAIKCSSQMIVLEVFEMGDLALMRSLFLKLELN